MDLQETICKRKERRFQTCEGETLQTVIFVEFEDPVTGTVLDISPGGLRLLCDGRIEIGRPFVAELRTTRLHGVYAGVVRRRDPWVDGKTVLGCQLLDAVPTEVLQTLASEGVIDRRRDDRVPWEQPAKLSWELKTGFEDVRILDCSPGGMRICSPVQVPDDLCLKIRFDVFGEEMEVDARHAWQSKREDGYHCGLAFTNREVPEAISRILNQREIVEEVLHIREEKKSSIRASLLVASVLAIFAASLLTIWVA